MNKDDIKKTLAGFSIAGLLSVAAISSPAHAASGWGAGKSSAGGTDTKDTPAVEQGAQSGKEGSEEQKAEQTEEEKAKAAEQEKKAGKSGWSGTKK